MGKADPRKIITRKAATEKRGRPKGSGGPRLKPDAETGRRVEQLVSVGMSEDQIALALGCSRRFLRREFGHNLDLGHPRRRAEIMDLLYEAARKGNVAAMKTLEQKTAIYLPAPPAPTKPPAIGKKEQADIDATEAAEGTGWAQLVH